jgi:hypothetical protein
VSITHTMSRRKKKGFSTILGTLIFIGILFSAIIPMQLVMQQADIVLKQELNEIESIDEERDSEDCEVYAYPTSTISSSLNVSVRNRCELDINIIRVWINETYYPVNVVVPVGCLINIGSFELEPISGSSYFIEVVTSKGNVYDCESGIIYFGEAGWEYEYLAINTLITSQKGVKKFKIIITLISNSTIIYEDTNIKNPKSGTVLISYDVTPYGPTSFQVDLYKAKKKDWTLFHTETVTIVWPSGPAVVWVYA